MRRFYLSVVDKPLVDAKRDLPIRTSPFIHYIGVIFIPPLLPVRRLTGTDYQHITANLGNIWETL